MIFQARIHIRGRLKGLPARRAATLAEWRGAKVVRSPSSADLCVVAHSCASTWGVGNLAAFALPVLSELSFRRELGLEPPLPEEARPFNALSLSLHSGLPVETILKLSAFDVIDGPHDYPFRDISVAREVRRFLDTGTPLQSVLQTGADLRARGVRLTSALTETPWGALAGVHGDDYVGIDGQLELRLCEPRLRFEEVFDAAADAEAEGDLDEAQRLYRMAAELDHQNGECLFNLGNVLSSIGRTDDALVAFLAAAVRDRDIAADAFYNAAILHRRAGSSEKAEGLYGAALRADPGHADARHNLALLLSAQERFSEAIGLWDALAGEGKADARRQAMFCRLQLRSKTIGAA